MPGIALGALGNVCHCPQPPGKSQAWTVDTGGPLSETPSQMSPRLASEGLWKRRQGRPSSTHTREDRASSPEPEGRERETGGDRRRGWRLRICRTLSETVHMDGAAFFSSLNSNAERNAASSGLCSLSRPAPLSARSVAAFSPAGLLTSWRTSPHSALTEQPRVSLTRLAARPTPLENTPSLTLLAHSGEGGRFTGVSFCLRKGTN